MSSSNFFLSDWNENSHETFDEQLDSLSEDDRKCVIQSGENIWTDQALMELLMNVFHSKKTECVMG